MKVELKEEVVVKGVVVTLSITEARFLRTLVGGCSGVVSGHLYNALNDAGIKKFSTEGGFSVPDHLIKVVEGDM